MPTNTTGPLKDVSKEVKYLNKDLIEANRLAIVLDL